MPLLLGDQVVVVMGNQRLLVLLEEPVTRLQLHQHKETMAVMERTMLHQVLLVAVEALERLAKQALPLWVAMAGMVLRPLSLARQ
jgi:hypothetical protein